MGHPTEYILHAHMLTRGDRISVREREDSGSGRGRGRTGVHYMGKRSTTTSRRLLLLVACLLIQVESWVASFSNWKGNGNSSPPSCVPMSRRRGSFHRRKPRGCGAAGSASSQGLILSSAAPTIKRVSGRLKAWESVSCGRRLCMVCIRYCVTRALWRRREPFA